MIYNNKLYSGDEISANLYGIELECTDNQNCTYEQHDSLSELIVQIGIDKGWRWPYYLVGHYEIAIPIGRRSDPLGIDWGSLMGRLYIRASEAGVGGLE